MHAEIDIVTFGAEAPIPLQSTHDQVYLSQGNRKVCFIK